MANFYLTLKASEDLAEIWNYTFDEWSEKQADYKTKKYFP
jgi:toxin ParE1/3/4